MRPPAPTSSGPTRETPTIAVARLGAVTGRNDEVSEWVPVHFNPASLQLQVSNELKDTRNNERKQYIAKSNAKLTMELQFDTTDTGNDVTQTTRKVQRFIAPPLPAGQQARRRLPPPVVIFEWGRVKFKGIAESYKETIDFFSASGVPLRASVNLTLSRQDQVFDDSPGGSAADVGSRDNARALNTPRGSAADAANAGQAPWAARSVAADNGQESLRFGDGGMLTLSAEITLNPPAAFASAGAGLGVGAGIGLGAGAAIGLDVGAGIGIGATAGTGIGANLDPGAAAAAVSESAGVAGLARLSATEGAFAALRVTTAGPPTARLNTARLVQSAGSSSLSTDRNATFQVGGKAKLEGPAGLSADVGAHAGPRGRLVFENS